MSRVCLSRITTKFALALHRVGVSVTALADVRGGQCELSLHWVDSARYITQLQLGCRKQVFSTRAWCIIYSFWDTYNNIYIHYLTKYYVLTYDVDNQKKCWINIIISYCPVVSLDSAVISCNFTYNMHALLCPSPCECIIAANQLHLSIRNRSSKRWVHVDEMRTDTAIAHSSPFPFHCSVSHCTYSFVLAVMTK